MRIIPLLAIIAIAGCDSDPTEPTCPGTGTVTGGVISGQTDQTVETDLVVRGVATDTSGLTIRRVLVAGIPALNNGFNFEQWSATIPIDTLAGMARLAGSTTATVDVQAINACDVMSDLGSFTVTVDPTPGVRVTSLTFNPPIIPSGLGYVPANGAISAELQLVANPDAAGATATLDTSVGMFSPGNTVRLEGDGTAQATATVLFSAMTPTSQVALITATAKGQLAHTTVQVAGPPTLIPGTATLTSGQAIGVTIQTPGTIEECHATPATGLTIKAGADGSGPDLMTTGTGDIRAFLVTADASVTTAVSSTVTCRDPYGQTTSAVYGAKP